MKAERRKWSCVAADQRAGLSRLGLWREDGDGARLPATPRWSPVPSMAFLERSWAAGCACSVGLKGIAAQLSSAVNIAHTQILAQELTGLLSCFWEETAM